MATGKAPGDYDSNDLAYMATNATTGQIDGDVPVTPGSVGDILDALFGFSPDMTVRALLLELMSCNLDMPASDVLRAIAAYKAVRA